MNILAAVRRFWYVDTIDAMQAKTIRETWIFYKAMPRLKGFALAAHRAACSFERMQRAFESVREPLYNPARGTWHHTATEGRYADLKR